MSKRTTSNRPPWHDPVPPPAPIPDNVGPYSLDNGADAYGHPVNAYGRCQAMNENPHPGTPPPACPNKSERATELANYPVDMLKSTAIGLNIAIPNMPDAALKNALPPLILTAEGYP